MGACSEGQRCEGQQLQLLTGMGWMLWCLVDARIRLIQRSSQQGIMVGQSVQAEALGSSQSSHMLVLRCDSLACLACEPAM